LPADGSRVVREVLHEQSQEFPRLDERLTGEPYRYAYAVGFGDGRRGGLPLWRHDLKTRETLRHDLGPHAVPGEFVFVPRSEQGAEDDGWLVGLVHNRQSGCA